MCPLLRLEILQELTNYIKWTTQRRYRFNQRDDNSFQFNWHRENGEIPRTATYDRNNRLILNQIRPEDTGRYVCEMTSRDHTRTQNYVDVELKREYRRRRQHRSNSERRMRIHD